MVLREVTVKFERLVVVWACGKLECVECAGEVSSHGDGLLSVVPIGKAADVERCGVGVGYVRRSLMHDQFTNGSHEYAGAEADLVEVVPCLAWQ